MGKKKRPAWVPKGSMRGKKLTPVQKEMIVQQFALCGNKSEVARNMSVSYPTVLSVLKEAETDSSLKKARTQALEEVAGKVHQKTTQIIDSITPEDMESGLIKQYDEEGQLKSVKAYGPSLMQKVTSAAILTDKMKVIAETKEAINKDQQTDNLAMPLPQDVESAIAAIGDRVKRLRILDVQFEDKNPELANKVQEVAHAASLQDDAEDASFEEVDFDNP
jgi:hypothetical protein